MLKLAVFAALAISGASAFRPLITDEINSQAPLTGDNKKLLVDSVSLQDAIEAQSLLSRAKKLYEIAKLGEPEYNHPTRVIGSQGAFASPSFSQTPAKAPL